MRSRVELPDTWNVVHERGMYARSGLRSFSRRIQCGTCLAGHYCPPGTAYPNQYPCPAGTFSDFTNLTDSSECSTCPARRACAAGSTSLSIVACEPGYYCPSGSATTTSSQCKRISERKKNRLLGPAGTWSNKTNIASPEECSICPAGDQSLFIRG